MSTHDADDHGGSTPPAPAGDAVPPGPEAGGPAAAAPRWRRRPPGELFADAEVLARLADELPHWYLEDGWIRRRIRTSGWKSTLMVVNTVGHLAEAAWHHPDLTVSYAFVVVKLKTHDAKGITEKDFALARQIEQVVFWRPGAEPEAALEGTPDDPRFRHVRFDDG